MNKIVRSSQQIVRMRRGTILTVPRVSSVSQTGAVLTDKPCLEDATVYRALHIALAT